LPALLALLDAVEHDQEAGVCLSDRVTRAAEQAWAALARPAKGQSQAIVEAAWAAWHHLEAAERGQEVGDRARVVADLRAALGCGVSFYVLMVRQACASRAAGDMAQALGLEQRCQAWRRAIPRAILTECDAMAQVEDVDGLLALAGRV
jgi:hypothetical protein